MDFATQAVCGIGVAHFSGGTPKVGGWEYFPGPAGLRVLTPREWHEVENGPFAKGGGTQAWIPKKNKGIQTLDVSKEENDQWEEERRNDEKRGKTKQIEWKLKTIEIKKRYPKRDRYREWIIRSRIRIRKEKDEEVRRTEMKLQEWCAEREREWWAAEVLGEDLDANEMDEIIEAVTPPALLDLLPGVNDSVNEAELLDNPPGTLARNNLQIKEDFVFKVPHAEWREFLSHHKDEIKNK